MNGKKRILIDLSILKHINCGLGQVAYNYGTYLRDNAPSDLEIHLLLPRSFFGAFGDGVKYVESNHINRWFPFLLPRYDVWHSIHQLSHYRPGYASTQNLLTIHDLNFLKEKKGKKVDKYVKKITRRIRRANRITAISNYAREDVLNHFSIKGDISVIYNGVERLTAEGEQRPSSIGQESRPFLFTIGQVLPKKNFHVLLDAMKQMPQYALFIAGKKSTSYGEMIERRIQEEGIDNVYLLGEIENPERLWLYNHCQAFLFPSLLEGFGLPIIEALFFKKPVISSKETSLKEVGGNAVFFLDNFEASHICETTLNAINYLHNHPEKAEENLAYANSFSYERHMQQYFAIYREMAGK